MNLLARLSSFACLFLPLACSLTASELESGWTKPPPSARLRAYWWWLNGNVTRTAITRDLEEMKAKGFGGALICDAGGAEQDGNDRVPHGPTFFTPEWRALYQHTLREADRLGLEMSLNIQSGWNLGGPMVTAEDAAKKLTWSETRAEGPATLEQKLPEPKSRDGFYRDLFVVAYRAKPESTSQDAFAARRRPIQNWEQKAMHKALSFSAPDTTPLLRDVPAQAGEEDARAADVLDLTAKLGADGVLRWEAPAGRWEILRFGCTVGDHSRVSTSSDGWKGFALDVLDAGAFRRYWDAVVEPLIADAGSLAGRTLKYLHTDSWEVEAVNWTPTLREEFRRRRGYDFLPFLPVLAGRIVESRPVSNRFLDDFRKTLGDLAIDNHYRLFRDGAHRHGLEIHPESGGPHAVPVDAQRCLGFNDVPMSEFWAWSWRHRVGDSNRFFVKQPASAAHTYGRRLVAAEGFTTIGPHWQERLWDNLKPSFDQAACEGLNRLVWHAFVCSPAELGMPGVQYFAGTHFNPNTTWWPKSGPFLGYINRCQFLLQQGLFVADACYYYGDHVPNFAQLKRRDPARVLPGYDYDVATEEVVLTRMTVRDGRIVLPDGMSYRVLVLPDRPSISLPVLRKLKELVQAGATVIGPKPTEASGLQDFPACDAEVRRLAEELWGREFPEQIRASNLGTAPSPVLQTPSPPLGERDGVREYSAPKNDPSSRRVATPPAEAGTTNGFAVPPSGGLPGEHKLGQGRVLWGRTAREVLLTDGVTPDFAFAGGDAQTALDYIHRRAGGTEIYFVANRSNRWENVHCIFRVAGQAPELWDPVTGERRFAAVYEERTSPTDSRLESLTLPITRPADTLSPTGGKGRGEGEFGAGKRASPAAGEGRTTVPLEFAPYGSMFVIFREPASAHPPSGQHNGLKFSPRQEIGGPWTVKFDPKWGGPESVEFERLVSWPQRAEPGIRFYSGTATYTKTFDLSEREIPGQFSAAGRRVFLDLGNVRELAEVRLNGRNLGVLWAPPWRVEITDAVKATGNSLEVEVVNFWPNRIIGDQSLPADQRFTRTNIRKLTKDTPLMESGLLGPVTVLVAE